MTLDEIKGFVELMKDIDTRNNLADAPKAVLPYLTYLIDNVEKAKEIFTDIETVETWDEWHTKDINNRIKGFLDN